MNRPPADQTVEASEGPIDLSVTPSFDLGTLTIQPSTREVRDADGVPRIAEPRVLQVLVALAQAAGAVVSRDVLVQRCWDGRIVGEDAIHRSIAKARQLGELTNPPAFTIESVPRVGYRLLPAGAAPADMTATPSATGAGTSRGLAISPTVARRGLIAAAAATAAATAGGYLWLRRAPADPLVAVLPFDNLSPDPQLGFFADGLSEDILNTLIRGGGVRVTSRTSSFTFRGAAKAKAAQALGAQYLLDGSVLREGSRLRVNAHLTDVARQQTLWSETYDRDLGQGLQIEDEVADKVASALKVRFTAQAPASRMVDPVAYDLYLRGRDASRAHTPERLREGRELLQSAVRTAPGFPQGWYELAGNYLRNEFFVPLAEQTREDEIGRVAARRAIALDPRYGAAYGVLTQLSPNYRRWGEIDAGLKRALELTPNDIDLLNWHSLFLLSTGRLQAAADAARRSQRLGPFDLLANHQLCVTLTYANQFQAAGQAVQRLATIWPNQAASYWDRFWLLAMSGREAEAIGQLEDVARRAADTSGEYPILTDALRVGPDSAPTQRLAVAKRLLDLAEKGTGYATNSILLLCRLRQFDEAVELARAVYLQKGSLKIDQNTAFLGGRQFPAHGEATTHQLFHSFVAPLRKSGRLNEVFDGIGLTEVWRTTGPPDAA